MIAACGGGGGVFLGRGELEGLWGCGVGGRVRGWGVHCIVVSVWTTTQYFSIPGPSYWCVTSTRTVFSLSEVEADDASQWLVRRPLWWLTGVVLFSEAII